MIQADDRILCQEVLDMSCREGSQNDLDFGRASTEVKLELFEHSFKAGVRQFEITAFAPSPWFSDSVELAQGAIDKARTSDDVLLRALYFNTKGLEQLLRYPQLYQEGIFHTAVTESYRSKNYAQGEMPDVLKKMDRFIHAFKTHSLRFNSITLSTAWGDRGEAVSVEKAVEYMDILLNHASANDLPVQSIALADTVGEATPHQVGALIMEVKNRWPQLIVKAHLHPRPELAEGCAHAALDAGVDSWEAAWGGVGGSPYADHPGGNLDIRTLMRVYKDRGFQCGFNEEEVLRLISFMKGQIQRPIIDISL